MKLLNYTYLLFVIVAASLLCACDSNSDFPDDLTDSPNSFNLKISVPMVSAKAADSDLHEFSVGHLHLYFFRTDGHDDATSEYVYDAVVDDAFEYSQHIRLNLPDDALRPGGLFGPTAATCLVYAVANVDESLLTARTVDGLKASIVGSDFDKTEPQPSFAMDGFATLNLDRTMRSVSGTITLRHAAAKLTLSVDLPDSIDVEKDIYNPNDGTTQKVIITYYSRPDDMHVWIANGVKSSALNTGPQPADEESLYSNDIRTVDGVGSPFTYDPEQTKYHYQQDIPFYSYPARWDSYSPKGNCYLTLEIPWYYVDDNGVTQNIVTYYRLSVQPGKNIIERNTLYDMRVTISRLGGLVVQKPVDMAVEWNYNILWNVETLPTDIREVRYLLLNNNDYSSALSAYSYTMQNETDISIPYNTSHPVEIESVELSWRDYLNNENRTITLTPQGGSGRYHYNSINSYRPATDFAGIEIDAENATLNLKRNIIHIAWNNNRATIQSANTAINTYTFTIKLRHTDATGSTDPSSHATVVITQNPYIYITTEHTTSANYRFINDNNTNYSSSNQRGYVTTSDTWNNINNTRRLFWLGSYHGSEYARNQNTYVLTISKFSNEEEEKKYIIADPRMRTVDNLNPTGTSATTNATWSVQATNMVSGTDNSRLRYYYPADRDKAKANFIAPQFRVASQWGVTFQISRIAAERRCASYQENGRPAGRWRVPTPAEIEYICKLSNKKYIPYLFGTDGETANYWCSTGGVDVVNDANNPHVDIVENTSDNTRRSVRCVYDEWFWKDDTLTQANKNRFRWGDRPRTLSGN